MQIVDSIAGMRSVRQQLTGSAGVVLTMGALHVGHLALVNAARAENDHVIVSIFVNPAQFLPQEDLAQYPHTLEHDLALLEAAGVDCVFMPTADMMYPPGYETYITVEHSALGLEGEARPGHFRGVATVVAKLFHLTQPTISYFGQKDAQQVVVLQHMVRDLNFPLSLAVYPTVRETDGLAMSSRNLYLTPDERAQAASLHHALRQTAALYEQGERDPAALRARVRSVIEPQLLADIDYVALNDPAHLLGVTEATDAPILLSLAVRFGTTRLLDNCLLPYSLNNRADLTALLGA